MSKARKTIILWVVLIILFVARGEFRQMDAANVARAAVAPVLMAALWKHTFAPHLDNAHEISPFFETSLDLLLRGIARTETTGGDA